MTAYDGIFIISIIMTLYHFHASTRQAMMSIKCISALLFAVYLWSHQAESAMYAALITALGAVIQACFPDRLLEKTKILRIGFALLLAGVAMIISAGSALEALPLIGVIIARLSDTQHTQQKIRNGYLLAQLCWFSYAMQQGIWLLLLSETMNILSNLTAITRHRLKEQKAVPVPLRTS